MRTYTVFGVDRVALRRTRHTVEATTPEQAEHLAHFSAPNLLVSAVLPGFVASESETRSAEPATV